MEQPQVSQTKSWDLPKNARYMVSSSRPKRNSISVQRSETFIYLKVAFGSKGHLGHQLGPSAQSEQSTSQMKYCWGTTAVLQLHNTRPVNFTVRQVYLPS